MQAGQGLREVGWCHGVAAQAIGMFIGMRQVQTHVQAWPVGGEGWLRCGENKQEIQRGKSKQQRMYRSTTQIRAALQTIKQVTSPAAFLQPSSRHLHPQFHTHQIHVVLGTAPVRPLPRPELPTPSQAPVCSPLPVRHVA